MEFLARNEVMATLETNPRASAFRLKVGGRKSLSYSALALFTFLYYWRPEDVIPGLSWVPMAKISGGIALLALIFGARPKDRQKLPLELKVLVLLLIDMIICIPFAYWRGGAFDTVINGFSKGVMIALLIALIVTQIRQMRKLLYIQVSAVMVITIISLIVNHTRDGRLYGVQKAFLENPNDLAINIAMNFPLCLAFLLAAKGGLRRLAWGGGLLALLWAVVATYSRSGMVAMSTSLLFCVLGFGIRGKRRSVLIAALVTGLLGAGVMIVTPHYLVRLESMVRGNIEDSGDKGSIEARKRLLMESISTALHHPIFGVGPGNFQVVNGEWRVAHNSYTELAAEAGLPALALFLLILFLSFRKIGSVRQLPSYEADENINLWTNALWAGLAAYASGAMFASTEYDLFPYFIVGYISALYQIATVVEPGANVRVEKAGSRSRNDGYGPNRKLESVWSR
jgi:O-antigen ligase